MISDAKALKILERLLEKSRADEVNWELRGEDTVYDISDADAFVVRLPQSSIWISFHTPKVDPDRYLVAFENKEGITVKRLLIDEEHPSWELAKSLFDEAGRVTIGWDRVLDDIESAVSSRERIGSPPAK